MIFMVYLVLYQKKVLSLSKNSIQYILPLKNESQYNSSDFIFSSCNFDLKDLLTNISTRWGYDPYPEIVILNGPQSCGKTHFCHLLKEIALDILIIENIDFHQEEDLLHIFNNCHENSQNALFTCRDYKHFKLPDLLSRLSSVRTVHINSMDDEMMKSLLIKLLTERDIKVSEDVVKFLHTRLPRDYATIVQAVEIIDRLSIEQKRNITVHFLSSINLESILKSGD